MTGLGAIANRRYINSSTKAAALAATLTMAAASYALAADMPVKAPPPKAPAPFFFVNDTSVSFTYYPWSTDPGVAGNSDTVPGGTAGQGNRFARYQGSIDHFDVWEYGTDLIHVEMNQYTDKDPVLGIPGAEGSREFFAFATSALGWNELTHSKAFSTFLTKDVSFMINGVAGVQNNFLSEETTQFAPGVQFTLNLPGVVNVGIAAYKEYTFNAFNACGAPGFGDAQSPAAGLGGGACAGGGSFSGDRDFEWTWKFFSFISEPLTFLPPSMPITFVNVLNITGPKGTGISNANCLAIGCFGAVGGFNNNETKAEVFEDGRLSLDASKVFWGKPGIWDTYVGYRYWMDKFGTNKNAALYATVAPGSSVESTVYLGTTYHFK